MVGYVLVGLFAAFGIFCGLWAILGGLLPGGTGGVVICRGTPGFPERWFVERYLFLLETGLIRWPLILVDQGLEEPERARLERLNGRIEICTLEELSFRLELERNKLE